LQVVKMGRDSQIERTLGVVSIKELHKISDQIAAQIRNVILIK